MTRLSIIGVATALAIATAGLAHAFAAEQSQAPFGGKVGSAFVNYNRASPFVGMAGLLGAGGAAKAKARDL